MPYGDDITEGIPFVLSNPEGATYTASGYAYDVAINGLPFFIAASDFTIKQLKNYQFYGIKEFETMDEFLTATRGAGSTTKTYTDAVVMGRTEADKNIIAIYKKLMGREPDEKELSELRPLLQKEQGKNPNVIRIYRFRL